MDQQTPASPSLDRQDNPILAVALEAALAAGVKIIEIYGREFSVETKADASPLTEADVAAETLIIDRLAKAFPDIPIIAEEAVANGIAPECGSRFFLVDPLDGSKEFIARNGEFTVNIALVEDGVPVLGVVFAPALKRIWWGSSEHGAQVGLVEDGKIVAPVAITVREIPEEGVTLVGSRSHGSGKGDSRLSELKIASFVSVGSSLKFCLVAEGGADIYPRFGRTMEWDTAAGDAILRAAGGHVLDLAGNPFAYGKRNQAHDSDFANGEFWAVGDGALVAKICPPASANDVEPTAFRDVGKALSHLARLEAESIEIFREVAASFERPVMMYSIGKDSSVLLHLARKAFYPSRIPFPLLHIDTTWNFAEMIAFRDAMAERFGFELIVHTNPELLPEIGALT
ncbi:MAG TPA: 3'(2'),5'-bisphosphate nucleotidase [Pelagibacterium sp.]|uniref:3'(2'),5'-bisphosphate nucleotidase CysQ n=1 Tax=uncultured Pelagibacterium sp. TaxID=1159875 RepID=UPI000EB8EF0B|nr:3'(2'),5'-bisphosphate nucleotidase [Pelagibacterium sp.]|tara:strand:- start:763 stop:1962 length:1200 start_codon:yes stop_codon:yes gene_type:complete